MVKTIFRFLLIVILCINLSIGASDWWLESPLVKLKKGLYENSF